MKKNAFVIIPALIAVVIGALVVMRRGGGQEETRPAQSQVATRPAPAARQPAAPPHSSPSQISSTERVPAHFTSPPSRASLPPTLDPEQFTGPTREAYRAVREIPQTIAQLPCYCHCDEGFGHKSLHSCFEDDHGAHCAVCVNEVLMAYQMEKRMQLTPGEIRARIVAQYSAAEDAGATSGAEGADQNKGKMKH